MIQSSIIYRMTIFIVVPFNMDVVNDSDVISKCSIYQRNIYKNAVPFNLINPKICAKLIIPIFMNVSKDGATTFISKKY